MRLCGSGTDIQVIRRTNNKTKKLHIYEAMQWADVVNVNEMLLYFIYHVFRDGNVYTHWHLYSRDLLAVNRHIEIKIMSQTI